MVLCPPVVLGHTSARYQQEQLFDRNVMNRLDKKDGDQSPLPATVLNRAAVSGLRTLLSATGHVILGSSQRQPENA